MKWWFLIGLLDEFAVPIIFLINLILRRWLVAAALSLFVASILPLQRLMFQPHWIPAELQWELERFLNGLPSVIAACAAGRITRAAVVWMAQSQLRALASTLAISTVVSAVVYVEGEQIAYSLPYPWAEPAVAVAKMLRPTCMLADTAIVNVPELPLFASPVLDSSGPPQTKLDARYDNLPIVDSAWDNFIGPVISIRTDAPRAPSYDNRELKVDLVVDERGHVIDAAVQAGASPYARQALAIARTWTFEPFTPDGRVQSVRTTLGVRIDQPSTPPKKSDGPTTINDINSVAIRLHVRPSFWGGPRYDILIQGNGLVTYDGDWGVALTGRHCAKLPKASTLRLIQAFQDQSFWSLNDDYSGSVTDMGTTNLSLSIDGRTKDVSLYAPGFVAGIPDAALSLPSYVEYTAQSNRWLRGNRFTAASLIAERWDFHRTDDANLRIVPGIVEFSDIETLDQAINAGAIVPSEPLTAFTVYPGLTVIEIAALQENGRMVRRLLSSGTRWNARALSGALVDVARTGDSGLVQALLSRGADPNHQDARSKKTALISASVAGVPAVVELLLKSGARTDLKGEFGRLPLHWAVTWLKADTPELPGADRVKVAELLLEAGAAVNARDDDGNTPLMSEWLIGADVVPLLIAHGADVNAQDALYEHTALMICRNPKVTQLLLEAGADPYAKDADGRTALDHAKASSWTEVANVLQAWIASHPQRR
jgi:ankyrin repeat protein